MPSRLDITPPFLHNDLHCAMRAPNCGQAFSAPALDLPQHRRLEITMPRKKPLRKESSRDFLNAVSECHRALSRLLEISNYGYLQSIYTGSQEETLTHAEPDKTAPPYVPPGANTTCVRCSHQWVPYVRQPRKCPKCQTPWWYMPRWRWRTKANAG